MKDMFQIAIFAFLIGQFTSQAHPASNDLLDKVQNKFIGSFNIEKEAYRRYRKLGYYMDKATVNDVSINTVSEEKKVEQTIEGGSSAPISTIEISGITTGANAQTQNVAPAPSVLDNTPFKPPRAGSMFARLIDDIFQIPITVLQSVARLITNPFTQKKTPEIIATIS